MIRRPPRSTLFPYTRSSDLDTAAQAEVRAVLARAPQQDIDALLAWSDGLATRGFGPAAEAAGRQSIAPREEDRKSTRLNSSHGYISYAGFFLKKKKPRPTAH